MLVLVWYQVLYQVPGMIFEFSFGIVFHQNYGQQQILFLIATQKLGNDACLFP